MNYNPINTTNTFNWQLQRTIQSQSNAFNWQLQRTIQSQSNSFNWQLEHTNKFTN